MISVNSRFDAGNIKAISLDDPQDIQLEIIPDNQSEFYQWFYFRLSRVRATSCRLKIINAGDAAYPGGFEDYRVLYSYDRRTWRRHPTAFTGGVLSWDFTPAHDIVYFSYFTPYSMERHHNLISRAVSSPEVRHRVLGKTIDGQDLDLLEIQHTGRSNDLKNCWLIARQHPGETMAEWWMEGLLEKLLDHNDLTSRELLQRCRFHIVPNMNPDGSLRGHLRTNAAGRNLNREWQTPDPELSPEVFVVKQKMQETGVDFFLDVHGDEALPYNFIAGTEGLTDWNSKRQGQLDFYKNTLSRLNPDFQTQHGYPPKNPGEANMTMSTSTVASMFGCLAMTLEMPFKDAAGTPDPEYGWSAERSKRLAHSCLEALLIYLK